MHITYSSAPATTPNHSIPKAISCVFMLTVFAIVLVESILSIVANHGVFSYALDDPYIHLALAERFQAGTYGINVGELSAPDSSLIWPFLLSLFPASLPGWQQIPWVLDLIFVLLTGRVLLLIVRPEAEASLPGIACLSLALTIALNLAGLVAIGMEHALQLLLTVLGVWGLVELERQERIPAIALTALMLAPLVRYENLSVTLAACVYLAVKGHWRAAITVSLTPVLALAVFSLTLFAHGLGFLPTSVLAKSGAIELGVAGALWENLQRNLADPQAWIVLALAALIVFKVFRSRVPAWRRLASFALAALSVHLIAGRFGWYSRYEIYIVAVLLSVLLLFYRDSIVRVTSRRASLASTLVGPLALPVLATTVFFQYAYVLTTIPAAAHDIYLQQMQMARFSRDYWRRPVAVHDLGAVSVMSRSYVLDFGGLASREVLQEQSRSPPDPLWMKRLVMRHQVDLVMIYPRFPDIPADWLLVAKLHLTVRCVTPADNVVFFFATRPVAEPQIRALLGEFSRSLPPGASLEISQPQGGFERAGPYESRLRISRREQGLEECNDSITPGDILAFGKGYGPKQLLGMAFHP